MIIIERKSNESIDRMVKRYKSKHRNIKLRNELRSRKQYIKPSVRRRTEVLSAMYSIKKFGAED